jgi:hypothetical protein
MSLKVLGKVYLDGNQFTTDPNIARSWPPRRSRLLGIGGSTTQQDFGRFAKDLRLTLTSHDLNFMNQDLVKTIEELMYVRRETYTYTDFEGIEGTVVIVDFNATPTYYKDGEGVLFEYQLVLDIVTLTKLNFVAYTGS